MTLSVRALTLQEHVDLLALHPRASHLQHPAWAGTRPGWGCVSVGLVAEGELVGAAAVWRRALPAGVGHLAYVPEGPVLDWSRWPPATWLEELCRNEREAGAFRIVLSPPLWEAQWSGERVRAAFAEGTCGALADLPPDAGDPLSAAAQEQLAALGCRPAPLVGGFTGWSRHGFVVPLGGIADEQQLMAGLSSRWRRQLRQSQRAGVEVVTGGPEDVAAFHELYVETAERQAFVPMPVEHFHRLLAHPDQPGCRVRLHLARLDGQVLAAQVTVWTGSIVALDVRGSTARLREAQPTTALDCAVLCTALQEGADAYDLRGISDTLAVSDPKSGMLQFKAGTGGVAVRYAGEWEKVLRPSLDRSFRVAQAGRRRASSVAGRLADARTDGGARGVAREVRRTAGGMALRARQYVDETRVDRRYGITTRGMSFPAGSGMQQERRPYQATSGPHFARALDAVPTPAREACFVDLGCGRGTALALAGDRGFRAVIGVEYDAELAQSARANAEVLMARTPGLQIEIVHGDAGEYVLPSGPLVVYLYNPFGEVTLRQSLDRAAEAVAAEPRPVHLVYRNPQLAAVIEADPRFATVATHPRWRVYRVREPGRSG